MLQLSLVFDVFDIVCEIRWTHQRKVLRRRPISFVFQTFCRGNETSGPIRFSMDKKISSARTIGSLCRHCLAFCEGVKGGHVSISSQAVSSGRSTALEERYVVVSEFTYRPEMTLCGRQDVKIQI